MAPRSRRVSPRPSGILPLDSIRRAQNGADRRRSPRSVSGSTGSRRLTAVLALLLAAVAVPVAAVAQSAAPAGAPLAETEHFRFAVQPNGRVDANAFVTAYGAVAERGFAELRTVFGMTAAGEQLPIKITVSVYADPNAFAFAADGLGAGELPNPPAIADPATARILVSLVRFRTLSPLEAENALRHATAHVLMGLVGAGRLPHGFDEGMADYVENQTNADLARYAALVQGANQGGTLLSWSDLNRPQTDPGSAKLADAESYAVVAFLVDRYGLRTFDQFLRGLQAEPDWRTAMRTAYGRQAHEVEQQWRDYLPRWAAGGGQPNLVAAFDLQPARDLFVGGNYAAAKAKLDASQRLFTDLGDQDRLAEVQALLAQCDTGIQAEALMTQAQQALEHHTYDRAQALLTQVRAQYDRLPPDQRPTALIDTYTRLAQSGIDASARLDEAQRRSHRWGDYRQARAAAVGAGSTFASLGDKEMADKAQALLHDLDARQRRLVLMLSALACLTLAWLALWLWVRGPAELDWR